MSKRSPASMVLALVMIAGAPSAHALTPEEIVSYRGADRQQVLIDGARKEGQVVLYSALIVNQMLRPLAAGFMKKYPFIKMTYYRADSEELLAKLSAETRANNVVADLFEGSGGGEIAVEAGFTQAVLFAGARRAIPRSISIPRATSRPRGSLISASPTTPNRCRPTRCRRHTRTSLDPQWQGKMAWPYANTGRYLFMINLRLAWGEERAMAYFRKLSAQKIINFASGSARTLVDRVIAGEYPIAINIYAHHPLISAGKGAPVNAQLMDPVPSASGSLTVLKGAKHPHAAMLLSDFILSREGQEIMAKAEYFPAHPDVEVGAAACEHRAQARRLQGELRQPAETQGTAGEHRQDHPAVVSVSVSH